MHGTACPLCTTGPPTAAWAPRLLLGLVSLQAAHLATLAVECLCMGACHECLAPGLGTCALNALSMRACHGGLAARARLAPRASGCSVSSHSCMLELLPTQLQLLSPQVDMS
jgi:hypothetical protein